MPQPSTERYLMHFALHNTSGESWASKLIADDPTLACSAPAEAALRKRMRLGTGGGYYFTKVPFMRAEAEEDQGAKRFGPWSPAAGSFADRAREVRGLRNLEPCCGSDHLLAEAFELLVLVRTEEDRLAPADSVRTVLQGALFGLELDPRRTQIAAFNLGLVAWNMEFPELNMVCRAVVLDARRARSMHLAGDLEGLSGTADDPNLFLLVVDKLFARGTLLDGMRW